MQSSESTSPTLSPRVTPDRPSLNLPEMGESTLPPGGAGGKDSEPIKIAVLSGRQELKLKIKQSDELLGPKVEILH